MELLKFNQSQYTSASCASDSDGSQISRRPYRKGRGTRRGTEGPRALRGGYATTHQNLCGGLLDLIGGEEGDKELTPSIARRLP